MPRESGSDSDSDKDQKLDLWKEAYKKMKRDEEGEKLLEKFREVVKEESTKTGNPIEHFRTSRGRKNLLNLINVKAETLDTHGGTLDKACKIMLRTKDIVTTGAAASPPAAVAVAGLFMAFTIQQNYRAESAAMFDCTLRIAKIIARRAVEDDQTQSKSPLESRDLKDLRQSLQYSYIDLYSKLLFAITKLVVKLDNRWRRWIDNVFGLSDWESVNRSLKDAEGECIEDLEAIHRYKSDQGAHASPFKNKSRNLLHQAAAMNFPDKVFEYVESGSFDVNAKTRNGWTALSLAAECGYFKVVMILTGVRGVDLNSQNKDGRTALHVATLNNRKATVKLLTEKGAKVDVKDGIGRTAFLDAAKDGFTEIVKTLKEKGADINQVTAKNGWTALHMAAWNDRPDTTKYLVSAGIKKDVKVKSGIGAGLTAREMAEAHNYSQVLEFLT